MVRQAEMHKKEQLIHYYTGRSGCCTTKSCKEKKKQIQAQDVVDAALSKVVVENKEKY